jgi:hypothetical protein
MVARLGGALALFRQASAMNGKTGGHQGRPYGW